MMHVAVLRARHIDEMLAGRKTVESRLSRVRCAPFGKVAQGDIIYIKESSGDHRAMSRARRILTFTDLTPRRVLDLKRQYNKSICGPDAYWREKRSARFATLIRLDGVEPVSAGPVIPKLYGRAWICLDSAVNASGKSDALAA